jgi:mRNA interferase MazF
LVTIGQPLFYRAKPITRGGITEVPINNLDKPSVVAASLIQTLSWRDRAAKKITTAESQVMNEVLYRIIPLIGGDKLLNIAT